VQVIRSLAARSAPGQAAWCAATTSKTARLGIQTSGAADVLKNRLIGNAGGIRTSGGLVQGNLIANTRGVGLQVDGRATVLSNTLTGSGGNALVVASGAPASTIQGNNFEFNYGAYDLVNYSANAITASGNWWGTTTPVR